MYFCTFQPRRTYATNICIKTVWSRSKGFNIIFLLHELQNYFYAKTGKYEPSGCRNTVWYVSVVTVQLTH